jgi:inner membrane protein
MDSLTQIVLGAAVGEAVLGKKVGNKAMLYGAIAGTIPDLDVLANYFTDTVTAIEWHRGVSHSVFFSIIFAPIFGWLIFRLEKNGPATWKEWSGLMFWGLFTHPILDAFTTWGTQLFWPFDLRLAFQNIFVIDPLYTLPFLVLLLMAMRQKRQSPKRAQYNMLGLGISTSYLALTLLLKAVAYYNIKGNLDAQGIVYEEMDIRPAPLNTILWSANIDAGDSYLIGNYSFFDESPMVFTSYPKNRELLGELSNDEKIARLKKITEGWFTVEEKDGQLYYNDLRFGLMSLDADEAQFAFSYKLIPKDGELLVEENPKLKRDAKKLLLALWVRIWGI